MTDDADLDVLSLPRGYELEGHVITDKLGSGSFGQVYLATSRMLGVSVAVKEYLPTSLATRMQGHTVVPNSPKRAADFEKGKVRFIEEGRTLAKLQVRHVLPNVLHVLQIIETNGTAYLVTKYYGRKRLQDVTESGEQLDPRFVMELLEKLLSALDVVHQAGLIHRDITPDNILLTDEGEPVLIDFGGARDFVNRKSGSYSDVIGKPGYMPIEQYTQEQQSEQPLGPGSDLYSLAATFYHLITGKRPAEALRRLQNDPLIPLMELRPAGYDVKVLMALDWCLRVHPQQRPESVGAVRQVLKGEGKPPARDGKQVVPPRGRSVGLRWGVGVLCVLAMLAAGWYIVKRPAEATLRVETEPPGAQVEIAGKGPYDSAMALKAGEQITLKVRAEGYEPQVLETMLTEGVNDHQIRLQKSEAQLRLNVEPAGARITLEGTDASYQPGMKLPVGETITVKVEAVGYRAQTQTLTLTPGENLREIRLTPEPMGVVQIEVNPADARIELLSPKQAYQAGMRLPVKTTLRLRVSKAGYKPKEAEVTIEEGNNRLSYSLSAEPEVRVVREVVPRPATRCEECPEMVAVSGGWVNMADLNGKGYIKSVHQVKVNRFQMSKHKVSFEQYDRYCKSAGVSCPLDEGGGRGSRPVVNVSWEDVHAYIIWLNIRSGKLYRLLNEEEWVYVSNSYWDGKEFYMRSSNRIHHSSGYRDTRSGFHLAQDL